jgi:hypothetical protein
LTRKEFPELYGYHPGTFVYRAQSVRLADLPRLERRLAFTHPSDPKPTERSSGLARFIREEGYSRLAYRQNSHAGYAKMGERWMLGSSEELAHASIYGRNYGDEPGRLKVMAVIQPDPERDPLFTFRTGFTGQHNYLHEAGIIRAPKRSQVSWYWVVGPAHESRFYRIVDRARLKAALEKHPDPTRLSEAIDGLVDRGVLERDPVLELVQQFEKPAAWLEGPLRTTYSSAMAVEELRKIMTGVKEVGDHLAPHRHDPRVANSLRLAREKLAYYGARLERMGPQVKAAIADVRAAIDAIDRE